MGNPDAGSVIEFINARSAIAIIGGIGLSVMIAFTLGTLVQIFSRMLFTFEKKNHTLGIRIGWSAIAFTVISYFLIIKGLKGVSFIPPDAYSFIYANMTWVSLGFLVFWGFVMTLLDRVGIEVMAAVVLGGTFSLALAFASNDLVNFIGVPACRPVILAGLEKQRPAG
jgi:hypothetical protein